MAESDNGGSNLSKDEELRQLKIELERLKIEKEKTTLEKEKEKLRKQIEAENAESGERTNDTSTEDSSEDDEIRQMRIKLEELKAEKKKRKLEKKKAEREKEVKKENTGNEKRKVSISPEDAIQKLRIIFESLEHLLTMKEFDTDLQNELSAACPNYMDVLLSAKRDLLRNDCAIVIAGETSAGKTTLINKLIGSKLFHTSNLLSTARVCRIRNSDTFLGIKTYTKDDVFIKELVAKDLKDLKHLIKKLSDIASIGEDNKDITYVDIYLPVSVIQENVIVVDTPGVGESENLDNLTLDFLPHAVSFVFLVNAINAGGIHKDRLSKIMAKVLSNKTNMPCFDPRDVMFLTNKWDIIKKESSSDEDDCEDQHEKTWEDIKLKLEQGWPALKMENIFRVSLHPLLETTGDCFFKEEYERFRGVFLETIDRNRNKRVEFYFSFVKNFTSNANRGIRARLKLLERTEEEQTDIVSRNKKKIKELKEECEAAQSKFQTRRNEIILTLVYRLRDYLKSRKGRENILNPPWMKPIKSVRYSHLHKEVPGRFKEGIQKWCQGKEVQNIFNDAEDQIKSFLNDIDKKFAIIENEITGSNYEGILAIGSFGLFSGLRVLAIYAWSLTLSWVLGIVLVPIFAFIGFVFISGASFESRVKDLYNQCLSKVSNEELIESLDKSFGNEYNKILGFIFDEAIPRKIESLDLTNTNLLAKQKSIKMKQCSLIRLKEMNEKILNEIKDFCTATGLNI